MKPSDTARVGFATIFGALVLVFMGTTFGFLHIGSLHGSFEEVEIEKLNTKNLLNDSYQNSLDQWYKENLMVRAPLIRTYNQIEFDLNHFSSTYVTVGQNNQYFAYNYFPTYRGHDYKGRVFWRNKAKDFRWLRDTLESHNIPLLVVIAPNKVRYMPENLPKNLVKTEGDSVNQWTMIREFEALDIPVLNLNETFMMAKDTTTRPLFPNTGTHWTEYGALLGGQMMMEAIGNLMDTVVAAIQLSPGVYLDSVNEADTELAEHMNVWLMPRTQELYFPQVRYDTTDRLKPDVLMISDSFFWVMNYSKLNLHVFNPDYSFWYYNNTCFDSRHGEKPIDELDRWAEILSRDVVVMMATESVLPQLPYGLVDDLKQGLE